MGCRRLLLDNLFQFTASVTRYFCEELRAKKIYSTFYHPQESLIAESYMRSVKKGLAPLVDEEGREWILFLFSVAIGFNSTSHVGTEFSPFCCYMEEMQCYRDIWMNPDLAQDLKGGFVAYGKLEFLYIENI